MNLLSRAALYFHTTRHLKPAQVWNRVLFRLRNPTPDLRPPPRVREAPRRWQRPAGRRPTMLGPRTFRFLNEEDALEPGQSWELPGRSTLWLYNLHYFDDMNAVGAPERADWHLGLLARWIAENEPGTGIGWDPYPTSLRIVNWVKWAWSGNSLGPDARQSLAVQARWLGQRLETHLLGNHLLANAKALVFAGCYFSGPEALQWLERGMTILRRQIPEQILPDGGHFERSTLYHALVLEDILDLLNIATACPTLFTPWRTLVSDWSDVARRMGHWLSTMCHPDGEIAFFNDAAMGIAPTLNVLADYARRLDVHWEDGHDDGVMWLENSGYVRAQRDGAVLFADVAPVGPDYLPAHAHADILSFELSLRGQRLVVNSGTSQYGSGKNRERERGTSAHNTVEVEGRNSSEVWAGFRVARRARPFDVSVREEDGTVRIEGAHDGYRRLRRSVVHRRTWELRDGELEVMDRLDGAMVEAVARVHFHPAVTIESDGSRGVARRNGYAVGWKAEGCEPSVVASTWHPEFGLSVRSSALALRFGAMPKAEPCRFVLTWSPRG